MTRAPHTPSPARSRGRISRLALLLGSAAVISGAIALPASAATSSTPRSSPGVVTDDSNPFRQPGSIYCKSGYVWRDSFDGDNQCVTPAERDAAHAANPNRQPGGGAYGPHTCKPGYVWRESYDGDTLCVTPAQRAEAKAATAKEAGQEAPLIDNGPNLIGIPGA
ncbi:hypothetical protein [Streptomyces sp. NPDC089799]|uniref:hypothetical protein n=1 Tax=Streptomyces sp. NPDC089799 TaxID=3155066 RepID=UPI00342CA6AE